MFLRQLTLGVVLAATTLATGCSCCHRGTVASYPPPPCCGAPRPIAVPAGSVAVPAAPVPVPAAPTPVASGFAPAAPCPNCGR